MAAFSLHGFSFFRHSRRTSVLVYFIIVAVYVHSINCASLSNSSEELRKKDSGNTDQDQSNNNSSFSNRQLLSAEQIIANNAYLQTPSFGFPIYHNLQQFPPVTTPYQQFGTSSSSKKGSANLPQQSQKKRLKVKVTTPELEEESNQSSTESKDKENVEKVATKSKSKKDKRQKEKLNKEENGSEKVESKTVEDDGTGRGCPACVGGICDSTFDPSTNITGIPLIQLLVALAVGAFWAAIFAFILHNFIEYKHHDEGGYGGGYGEPTPQYGAPVSQYGAPSSQYGTPQSEYGAPTGYSSSRISYGNGYGRSSRGFTFNDMSNWVSNAIDKLSSMYDN